jgi:hypothetical protein
MSKPIFIIKFPQPDKDLEKYQEQYKFLTERLFDYHVLFSFHDDISSIQFECFNSSQVPETTIEELKSMVLESLSKPINEN